MPRLPLCPDLSACLVVRHLVRVSRQRRETPAGVADGGPLRIGMPDVPGRVQLPRRLAQHIAEDEQSPLVHGPRRGVAPQFDGVGRAAGAESTVLRLVSFWIGDKLRAVFGIGEVVAALRQIHTECRVAASRLAPRHIGYRVIAQQHHRPAPPVPHGSPRSTAALKAQQEPQAHDTQQSPPG